MELGHETTFTTLWTLRSCSLNTRRPFGRPLRSRGAKLAGRSLGAAHRGEGGRARQAVLRSFRKVAEYTAQTKHGCIPWLPLKVVQCALSRTILGRRTTAFALKVVAFGWGSFE